MTTSARRFTGRDARPNGVGLGGGSAPLGATHRVGQIFDRFIPTAIRRDPELAPRARLILGVTLGALPMWIFFAFYLAVLMDLPLEGMILAGGAALMVTAAYVLRFTGRLVLSAQIAATTLFAACLSHALIAGDFPMYTLAFYIVIPFALQLAGMPRWALVWGLILVVTTAALYSLAIGRAGGPYEATTMGRRLAALLGLLVLLSVMAWAHEMAGRRAAAERARLLAQLDAAHRLESAGAVAATMAHDFNNVLTVIQSYGNLLLDSLEDDEQAREDLGEMLSSARRGAELTQAISVFARSQPEVAERFGLSELVEESRSFIENLLGTDVRFAALLAEDLPPVKADRTQLHRVLLNLLVNAKEAMPEGGALKIITDLAPDADIDPVTLEPGRYVRLIVADTGHGIAQGAVARVFEPFFTTKRPSKGSGLGLSTAYGIVRGMGGTITADSEAGAGSTFAIYLPADSSAS